MQDLTPFSFAERLAAAHIHYQLAMVRPGYIMFQIAVPGERWEVEFSSKGEVEVEVFRGNGDILDDSALDDLFERFTD
jgi:hypothetical protein